MHTPSDSTPLTFARLHLGDRFTLIDSGQRLFTKVADDRAREHGVHSINLKEEGYGQADDPVVPLAGDTPVAYVPVGGPLRVGG